MSPPETTETGLDRPGPATHKITATAKRQHLQGSRPAGPVVAVGVPLPYGRDHPNTDAWLDRDGQVHRGDGPYVRRPLRVLRRKINALRVAWRRRRS